MSRPDLLKLSSLLRPEMIWLDVPDEPIEFISKGFCEMSMPYLNCSTDKKEEIIQNVVDCLVDTQRLGITGIGQGFAFLEAGKFKEKWMNRLFNPPSWE